MTPAERVFASSATISYNPGSRQGNTLSDSLDQPDAPLKPPTVAVSPSQEAAMPRTFTGNGRPPADEAARRKGRFLTLMAEGMTAEQAARAANLSPWRALRIVTESDFLEIVQLIRAGAGPIAVETVPGEQDAGLAA